MDLLLNANYFILDPGSDAKPSNPSQDKWVYEGNQLTLLKNRSTKAYSRYNIKYLDTSCLDPTVFMTTILSQTNDTREGTTYAAVQQYLNQDKVKSEVMDALFKDELKGNEIQVCIYNDDDIVINFGNLICSYLAYNFGADVIFLDAMCRRNVYGQGFYPGNKEVGQYTVNYLRDYNLLDNFSTNMTTSNLIHNTSNLSVWLGKKDFDTLFRLYNLLFPNEPLSPGNYTKEMLVDIIAGKCGQSLPVVDRNSPTGELIYSTQDLFSTMMDEFNTYGEQEEDGWDDAFDFGFDEE
jgi:hypothetical protein